jgi:hypothetical protein
MIGKMLSRDLNAHRFACGCCQDFGYSGKGKKRDRRKARRRENNMFREGLMGRWEI